MKKSAFSVPGAGAFLLIAAGLSGCPIYDDADYGCFDDLDCEAGYSCEVESGRCYAEPAGQACRRPRDCGTNETCSRSATCMVGDCHFDSVGCVQGYECQRLDGQWTCVDQDMGQGGAPSSSAGAPASNGGAPSASGGAPPENGGAPSASGGAPAAGSSG